MQRRKAGRGGGEGHSEAAGMMRWLLTYADMITLLLALFIMLFAISQVEAGKFKELSAALVQAFGGGKPIFKGGSNVLSPSQDKQVQVVPPVFPAQAPNPELKRAAEAMEEGLEKEGLTGAVVMEFEERGLRVSVLTAEKGRQPLFERGEAVLKPATKVILSIVAKAIRNMSNPIRIEGHTCNLPISTGEFPSNWELSTRRATNVLRYFIEAEKIPADRLSAAGYADTKPLQDHPLVSELHRQFNRRVDIVILKQKEGKLEPK